MERGREEKEWEGNERGERMVGKGGRKRWKKDKEERGEEGRKRKEE